MTAAGIAPLEAHVRFGGSGVVGAVLRTRRLLLRLASLCARRRSGECRACGELRRQILTRRGLWASLRLRPLAGEVPFSAGANILPSLL